MHYQIKDSFLFHQIRQFLEPASSVFESNQQTRNPGWPRIAELKRMFGRLTMEMELELSIKPRRDQSQLWLRLIRRAQIEFAHRD